jgi:hypothetical protein
MYPYNILLVGSNGKFAKYIRIPLSSQTFLVLTDSNVSMSVAKRRRILKIE